MRHIPTLLSTLLLITTLAPARAADVEIVVHVPDSMRPKSAVALARELKLESPGTVRAHEILFPILLPDTSYDIAITLSDGTILQGVDLNWLNEEPAKPDAGELTAEDRDEILKILTAVKSFYNKNEILLIRGDHTRATALVRLMRDRKFYADKGGEIIWRMELYYFRFQYGGWEKVQQANKVLRRERFQSREEFRNATENIRWTQELGGVRTPKEGNVKIELKDTPTTKESENTDEKSE